MSDGESIFALLERVNR